MFKCFKKKKKERAWMLILWCKNQVQQYQRKYTKQFNIMLHSCKPQPNLRSFTRKVTKKKKKERKQRRKSESFLLAPHFPLSLSASCKFPKPSSFLPKFDQILSLQFGVIQCLEPCALCASTFDGFIISIPWQIC